ncbi:MFS transporter [Candidatus Contubernalis alkaliaceticus]|uniref:MFS transporter n=1 Tax=Candidatus Contubernalis alkaliaceticus TaxID=338645 RepID=UPI001F4C0020|nr:MFS transporter [Candidatus Contubernalis alkalaceticus]UNC91622.1 MFS transporter [Candidatus Contubernalis alkalaceticus]
MILEKNTEELKEEKKRRKTFINLGLLFGAAFIVFINFSSSLTVLPLYVLELGGTEFVSGLQNTIFFLAAIFLRFYFGPLADSNGRKLPLIIGAFAFATAPLLFLVSNSLWMLLLSRVYQAVGLAAFFSSSTSLVADLAPENKKGTYISSFRILMSLALLTGPTGSMILVNQYGYSIWFISSFSIGLLGIILTALLTPPTLVKIDKIGSWQRYKLVLMNSKLRLILQGVTLVAICIGALLTYAIIHVSRSTELANPAVYFTYYALAGITANIFVGRLSDRLGRQAVLWPAIILSGLGLILLFFLPNRSEILMFSSLLSGIGTAGSISVGYAWVVDTIEEKMRATALALLESVIDSSIALGSFFFGLLGTWIGLGSTFGLTGLLVTAAGVLFFLGSIISKNKSSMT